MHVLGSESRNEVKKAAGGKKAAGKGDPPTTAKSQDKKGEKKVYYLACHILKFCSYLQLKSAQIQANDKSAPLNV